MTLQLQIIGKVANIAKEGRLVEIARGADEVKRFRELIKSHIGIINGELDHELMPGEVGGNHYHKKKKEVIVYTVGEGLRVDLTDPATGKIFSTLPKIGSIFYLPPEIGHALVNTSKSNIRFREYSGLAFDPKNPKNDVHNIKP